MKLFDLNGVDHGGGSMRIRINGPAGVQFEGHHLEPGETYDLPRYFGLGLVNSNRGTHVIDEPDDDALEGDKREGEAPEGEAAEPGREEHASNADPVAEHGDPAPRPRGRR